ncbi:hypothetical protein A3J44_07000 [candidate division WOR-1 bacterium RIFCSPHIGHO2_02_FULL_45_12]|nr:MAG: hypothetical protein A3J44_07000 [candidate division WOR-1 bacterium RIFCSPHIGHO2_02_FULL_45_12]
MNLVFVSGGGGTRDLARALAKRAPKTAYVIGGTDDGGHTRYVRRLFPQIPGIGDWRARCLDLADDNPAATLARYRFSSAKLQQELETELRAIISGEQPLVQAVEEGSKKEELLQALASFDVQRHSAAAQLGTPFPLQGGSLGNILLTGEILLNGGAVRPGLSRFANLVGARDAVIPATLGNYHLQTTMADGRTLTGQVWFSAKDPEYLKNNTVKIRGISYRTFDYDSAGQPQNVRPATPELNPEVREAIASANAIVFAMGSFYMSIVSVLMIPGFGACVRESQAPKIMIGNPTYEPETFGLTAARMARIVIESLRSSDTSSGPDSAYLSQLLFHNSSTGEPNRIPLGKRDLLVGIEVQTLPLLNAAGKYDSEMLAEKLVSFVV